uniref:Sodium-coupled neutral amino acid symporter 2 n=1 Tax=Oncorhynchus kisutch TaxID=8019 RepID=A0A8C7FCF0_ONCKI
MKQATAKTEMSRFSISPDEDSSVSSNSHEYSSCPTKKVPIDSQYPDMDAESQNFLPDYHLDKKKYETDYHPGTASFGMSVFNLGNAIMGSGILGLSYAMANTGIALFVILLVAVSIFSLYSVHLLLKTANEGGSLVYEQLGYKAFGMPGKLAASISITMQNIGAMSSYLYIVKYELPIVIQAFVGATNGEWYANGDYLVILVSVVIILPLSLLRNLGYLGYTSGFSLLCMVFFLIVVIYKKFQIPCPYVPNMDVILNETVSKVLNNTMGFLNTTAGVYNEDVCTPKYFVFNSQTVYAVPILTFAFVCHPAVLPMYEELKDRSRRKMQGVANVSFLAMFIMYLLAALFGYLTFNGDPFRVNQLLCASKEFSWIRHTIITMVLLASTNCLVIFVPSIRDIFGFIGASAAAMLIFILPSAFYIKLVKKEPMKSVQKIGASIFLCSGFFVMIGSLTLITLDWINNASQAANGH